MSWLFAARASVGLVFIEAALTGRVVLDSRSQENSLWEKSNIDLKNSFQIVVTDFKIKFFIKFLG